MKDYVALGRMSYRGAAPYFIPQAMEMAWLELEIVETVGLQEIGAGELNKDGVGSV